MTRRSGFTLVELMVVVGIMVLIASIVVTGTFGMSRASGYLAAENIVYNTLQAARQKACTDGKRVVVAFVKREEAHGDEDNFSLVTVEASGTISEKVGKLYIEDRGSVLANFAGNTGSDSIWNLKKGCYVEGPFKIQKRTVSTSPKDKPIPFDSGAYEYTVIRLQLERDGSNSGKTSFDEKTWEKGDAYGFQIGERQELPLGFMFGFGAVGKSPEGQMIVFEPDGTSFFGKSSKTGIGSRESKEAHIFIYEEIAANKAIEIIVNDGVIQVKK